MVCWPAGRRMRSDFSCHTRIFQYFSQLNAFRTCRKSPWNRYQHEQYYEKWRQTVRWAHNIKNNNLLTTILAIPPDKVSKLTVTYGGQYSRKRVSQDIYLYNYKNASWDLINTSTVGNTDDEVVQVTLFAPQAYLSSNGESRVRIRGFRENRRRFYCWANYLSWEVQ